MPPIRIANNPPRNSHNQEYDNGRHAGRTLVQPLQPIFGQKIGNDKYENYRNDNNDHKWIHPKGFMEFPIEKVVEHTLNAAPRTLVTRQLMKVACQKPRGLRGIEKEKESDDSKDNGYI